MEQMLLSPISLEALKAEIGQIVRHEILSKQRRDFEDRLLSPAETCKLFQPSISRVTLHKWTQEGRLQEYRIGGRVYYKYSEVIDSLQRLRKYQRL